MLAEPPPWAGAVLQSTAGLENSGSVVLGAWQLAGSRGEQGEGLQSSSWAVGRGQWWGHQLESVTNSPPLCRALGCVSCWWPSPGTPEVVMPGEGSSSLGLDPALSPRGGWWPQGHTVHTAWSLPWTGTALGMGSHTSRSQTALSLLIQYLSCPALLLQESRCPHVLPEAEHQRNP